LLGSASQAGFGRLPAIVVSNIYTLLVLIIGHRCNPRLPRSP
jgi:hypothetical protein